MLSPLVELRQAIASDKEVYFRAGVPAPEIADALISVGSAPANHFKGMDFDYSARAAGQLFSDGKPHHAGAFTKRSYRQSLEWRMVCRKKIYPAGIESAYGFT